MSINGLGNGNYDGYYKPPKRQNPNPQPSETEINAGKLKMNNLPNFEVAKLRGLLNQNNYKK